MALFPSYYKREMKTMNRNRLFLSILALCACFSAAVGATRTLPVSSLKAIVVEEAVSIQYVVGPLMPVVISGSDSAMESISVSVSDGVLLIRRVRHIDNKEEANVNVTVSAPALNSFSLGSDCKLVCSGNLDLKEPFEFTGAANAVGVFGDISAPAIRVSAGSYNGIRLGHLSTDGDFNLTSKGFDIINIGEIKVGKTMQVHQSHNTLLAVENDVISGAGSVTLDNNAMFSAQKWFAAGTVMIHTSGSGIFRTGFLGGPALMIYAGTDGEVSVDDCACRTISAEGASGSTISLSNIDAESVTATTDSGQIVLTGHAGFGAITTKNGLISQKDFQIGSSK